MKVCLQTYGCQMNLRDSEFVMGLLLEKGFRKVKAASSADVVLFNSCSVRQHAEDRLFSNISDLKKLKAKRPGLVIGLMGCAAQKFGEKALARAPMVDIVCGPGNETGLPAIIKEVRKNRCPIIASDKVSEKRPELFPAHRESAFKAYVSISEGCDNFCSYCIVPYVRGKERSRKAADIIKEVEDLAVRGFKEITLLGQNVNSYKKKPVTSNQKPEFVKLLEKLNKIKGIERIRFMTSHPKDASAGLFKTMRGLENVCEHLHLPLQSGSDRILKLMNRRYTAGRYLGLVKSYKKAFPEGAITTDVLVGFPSETESDFQKTYRLMKKAGFDGVFVFKYSPRPPAKSAALKDDVAPEVKQKRLEAILGLQSGISLKRNESMKGKAVEVLVDGRTKKEPSLLSGRTRTNKIVVFKGPARLIGRLVNVKIYTVTPYALKGRVVK